MTPSHEREIRSRWTAPQLVTSQHMLHVRDDIGALLKEVDALRTEAARRDRTLGELRRVADDVTARVRTAEAAMWRVRMVKVWRNEDGREFVFADDLWAATDPEIVGNVEAARPITLNGADRG